MNLKKYWFLTSLKTFILLPLLLSCALFFLVMSFASYWVVPLGLFPLGALFYSIYKTGKNAPLPDAFLSRYAPYIAPILYTLAVWLLTVFLNEGDFSKESGFVAIAFLPFVAFIIFHALAGTFWLIPVTIIGTYLFFVTCFAVGTWRGKRFRTTENRKALYALALTLALACAALVQGTAYYQSVLHHDPDHPQLQEENSRVVPPISLTTPPSLQIDRDYPKLDGATAAIPIYDTAAKAIYREGEKQDALNLNSREKAVGFSRATPAAYKALIDGRADIIFTIAPSEEQIKEAAKQNLTYTVTPIGREAFVFLVNEQNPVKNLSVGQIRDIYSGNIDNWRDVGGTPGKIMAFQRNEGSGSQIAMRRYVMNGMPMRKPLKEEYFRSMDGIIRSIADYRNLDNAIGYSFRYYATAMNTLPGIYLLSVDNVAPTVENIRNSRYPFTGDICMVTARPLSENAQKLHDWFLSDEGQQLIEQVGYVALKNASR